MESSKPGPLGGMQFDRGLPQSDRGMPQSDRGMPQSDPGVAIINGTPAQRCQWPHQLGMCSGGNCRGSTCGASLVSATWAVTATHCLDGTVGVPPQISTVTLFGGDIRAGGGERRVSSRLIRHPRFDLALVQISQPFRLNNCLNVARLPSGPVQTGAQCWITGWGRTNANGGGSNVLMQAQTSVVSLQQCRSVFGSRPGFTIGPFESDVCVGGRGTSACFGDSGGPLICNGALYGATSWGPGSCNGLTIYAGTWGNIDWIRSNMRR